MIITNINGINNQEKTVSPTNAIIRVTADSGYTGLKNVVINAVTLQEKTVSPAMSSINVIPDASYNGLGKVVINAMPSYTDLS